MIHTFSLENIYSIDKEMSINFLVDKKFQADNSVTTTQSDSRVSLVEAIIGPNASGKTNVIRGLSFTSWLIKDSFDLSPDRQIPFKQFMTMESNKKPSKLAVTFEMESDIYTYSFKLSRKRIFSENLKMRNFTNQNLTTKKIFERKWNSKNSTYTLSAPGMTLPRGFRETLRENASLISTAYRFNNELSKKIVEYWEKFESNVNEAGWHGDFDLQGMMKVQTALNFYEENQEYKSKAEEMLARFDIGFHSFDFEDEDDKGYKIAHKFNAKTLSLPIRYESSGSKQLFVLLSKILVALDEGGLVAVDEMDANLHPDMVSEIISLFTDPETNPKKAQIILSTHSHRILSELNKYQIVLTEKNDEGATEVWRLDSLKGVRADDNYFNKYMAGAYGAVPQFS